MRENEYQSLVIKKIRQLLPGCLILKNDPGYIQGIPDLLILFLDRWAALEVKPSREARISPNQQYYVDFMDSMSYASFIYPENEREVLDALQYALASSRPTRLP